jgi:hypothetical protein
MRLTYPINMGLRAAMSAGEALMLLLNKHALFQMLVASSITVSYINKYTTFANATKRAYKYYRSLLFV